MKTIISFRSQCALTDVRHDRRRQRRVEQILLSRGRKRPCAAMPCRAPVLKKVENHRTRTTRVDTDHNNIINVVKIKTINNVCKLMSSASSYRKSPSERERDRTTAPLDSPLPPTQYVVAIPASSSDRGEIYCYCRLSCSSTHTHKRARSPFRSIIIIIIILPLLWRVLCVSCARVYRKKGKIITLLVATTTAPFSREGQALVACV